MKLAGVGLLAGLVVASVAHRAEAECGNPHWMGTPNGATIPQKGSLYQYDQSLTFNEDRTSTESYRLPKLKNDGPIVKKTRVSDAVVKIDYATIADELEFKDDFEATVYNVSPSWQPPAAAPRVIQYWHEVSSWTCSSTDSVMLQVDQPTAAFRVFWEYGGHTKELILPARTSDGNISVLELGKINCGSTLLDPAELAVGGKLTLLAIRYDGSEVAVTGLPAKLATSDMPTGDQGISRAIGYQAGEEPTRPVPPPDHDWPFHLFLMLLVPAAALAYVAYRNRPLKAVV